MAPLSKVSSNPELIYCSSDINEGRDEYSRAQAKQNWNTVAERFLKTLE
jgi:hypothetical protein